jgi:quinol monooxygenase YgiN
MFSFTVRFTFEEGTHEAIAELLRELTGPSRKEPGCVSYIPHFVEGEPLTVVIYEQYVNEAALEDHRNTPHFQEYGANRLFKLKHTRHLERLDAVA